MNQIIIMEMPRHILVITTSHEVKILRRFLSYVAYVVIQAHNFVTFLGIDYDKKWALQISDDRIIIIRIMTKKYVFVVEDLLWHGIGDESIFVTQMS